MAVTTPLGMGRTIPSSGCSLKKVFIAGYNCGPNLKQFVGQKVSFSGNRRSSNLCSRCSSISDYGNDCDNSNTTTTTISDASDWDWNRWVRHFAEIEEAESFSSVLKFLLEETVEKEDFQEAAKLKSFMADVTSKDTVAEIMSELKKAIDEERYHDASRLSRSTGSGLVGWWIGSRKDSVDPVGRLIRITPGFGKFIGRGYTPRQLVTGSPGTTLFEIYVVKDTDDTYIMQVVYLQRSKGTSERTSTSSVNLQPKPRRDSPSAEPADSPAVDIQANKDKPEKQEEKVPDIEEASEEGINSVINFLKDKIPGLKVKVMDISIGEEVTGDDAVKLTQESSEDAGEDSNDDDLDKVENSVEGNGESAEDGKDLDMKVYVSGIVHNEDDASSKEGYIQLPGQIRDAEKDSFVLHIPGIRGSEENLASDYKVPALAAQGFAELLPSDVAKVMLGSNMLASKFSRDVREFLKHTIIQLQKRIKLSEYTQFSRITIPRSKTDPFDGLYVGAFGPYGIEIVQLRRKFGHWNNGSELNDASDVEFFEYVEAVKLTGDLRFPAGEVTFRAKIGRGNRLSNRGMYPDELGVVASYKGRGRTAGFGFKNPKWVEGELLQLNGKGIGPFISGAELGFLYIIPERSFLVLFKRLDLPE